MANQQTSSKLRIVAGKLRSEKLACILRKLAMDVSELEESNRRLSAALEEKSAVPYIMNFDFDPILFSERLCLVLEAKGVLDNYTAWANEHGVRASSLFNFMRCQGTPQMATFFKLCYELEVDPGYLMGLDKYEMKQSA